VHYRTLDVPRRFDCHVALLLTDHFSATDGTVYIGVQDRRFLSMRMVYLLKTERDAKWEAKASTVQQFIQFFSGPHRKRGTFVRFHRLQILRMRARATLARLAAF
jgi:hypothetical protein